MYAANSDIIHNIQKEWGLTLRPEISEEDLIRVLGERINDMIRHDMQTLFTLLYRIDVSEKRIREMLATHKGVDAGLILAALVLDRQKQKLATRKLFQQPPEDIPEDEKW